MNKELAEQTVILALQIGAGLDSHLSTIEAQGTEEEFTHFQQVTGNIMGDLIGEYMFPIFEQYPELKPTGMGGTYEVDPSIYR